MKVARQTTLLVGAIFALASAGVPVAADRGTLDGTPEDTWQYEGGEVAAGVDPEGTAELTGDSPEVKYLAGLHGVADAEALALMNSMIAAEQAIATIRSRYPESFAGSEFLHDSGRIDLVLWITGDGAAELKDLRSELGGKTQFASVEVAKAPKSELALTMEIETLAAKDPEQLGFSSSNEVHGSVNFKTGSFVPEDPEVIATLQLDSHDQCNHGTGGGLDGGRMYRKSLAGNYFDRSDGCEPGNTHCTSGFAARYDGFQGILTAGHCLDDFSSDSEGVSLMYANSFELYASLRAYFWDSLPDDDAGFAREKYASAAPAGRIYLDPNNGFRIIEHLLPDPAPNGGVRCIKSAGSADIGNPPDHTDGFKCGDIETNDGNYCHFGFCRYTKVTNAAWNDFPRPGSSGGSWFIGTAAAGTHTDSVTDAGIYYRLGSARNAMPGLTLYCDGFTASLCAWP